LLTVFIASTVPLLGKLIMAINSILLKCRLLLYLGYSTMTMY